MSVKSLDTGMKIELIDEYYLRTNLSKVESLAVANKKRVFRETAKHFTRIEEREDVNIPDTRELYYEISVDDGKEMHLDSFRLMAQDAVGKQLILDGLMEMFLLISEGKIYDVEMNPLNFIAEDKPDIERIYIKAFYRKDRGLREITNEWLNDVKKLIGYFLVGDTGINETNFSRLRPVDIYNRMSGSVAEEYLKIIKSTSVDQMAREWFTPEVYNQVKGFPPIVNDFRTPKDVTDVGAALLGNVREPEYEETVEDKYMDLEEGEYEEEQESKVGIKKVLIMALIGLGIGGFFGIKIFGGSKVETVEVPVHYYEGMIQASIQKYKDAGTDFDLLTEDDLELLGDNELLTIYIAYLKGGEFDKALEIDPDGAETVITYLQKRDRLSEVLDMSSTLPVIQFEKAVLEKDYETVVSLKGEVRDTEERQQDVIKALVLTGDIDIAVEYVKEKDIKGMEKKVREWYNQYADGADLEKSEIKDADEKIKELPKENKK